MQLKNLTALLLIIILTASYIIPVSATDQVAAEPKSVGNQINGTGAGYGNALVAVARAELVAYGSGSGGSKYWNAYANYTGTRYASNTPWCVAFVYYCAYQCGYLSPEGEGCFGSTWQISCRKVWNDFYPKGKIYTSTSYIPAAGDLILYGKAGFDPANPANTEHIGIVEYADRATGKLTTIEGNANNTLKRLTYKSYRVGTHAFDTSYIIGYVHPSYPDMVPDGPLYSYVPGLLRPTENARIVGAGKWSTIIAGETRMIGQDFITFIKAIPSLDKDLAHNEHIIELLEAAEFSGSEQIFRTVSAWNAAVKHLGEDLTDLQTLYAVDTHIAPVHQTALSRTGFDWMQTDIRREILWEVATCTPYPDAAGLMLASFATGLDNNATDAQVIEAYNSWLGFCCTAFRFDLWYGFDYDTVQLWVENLTDFGHALEYLNQELNPEKNPEDGDTVSVTSPEG